LLSCCCCRCVVVVVKDSTKSKDDDDDDFYNGTNNPLSFAEEDVSPSSIDNDGIAVSLSSLVFMK